MKDIFQLMESSCGSYLKKIIGSFTSIALAEFLICWWKIKDITYLDIRDISFQFEFTLGILLSVVLLIWFNFQRVKRFVESGGLTRVKLLPISSNAYAYSELLLAFIGVISLVTIQYVAAFGLLFIHKSAYVYESNALFFALLNSDALSWYVLSSVDALKIFLILIEISYCLMILSNTLIKEDKGFHVAVSLAFVFILSLFNFAFFNDTYIFREIFSYLLLLIVSHFYVRRVFSKRRLSI